MNRARLEDRHEPKWINAAEGCRSVEQSLGHVADELGRGIRRGRRCPGAIDE